MKIDILTLFPEMFQGPFDQSIIKRAREKGLVEIKIHNLRNWAEDKHRTVDDRPYGGGPGMILKVDIIDSALQTLKQNSQTLLLSPQGKPFSQPKAQELSKKEHLILLCGHYEGVDERARNHLVDEEISIGDYVLTGGELPAMVIIDAVTRLIPGVLENPKATQSESFSTSQLDVKRPTLLDYPQYTPPEKYRAWSVPKILLSGDHQKIKKWRRRKAREKTKEKRPDLIRT